MAPAVPIVLIDDDRAWLQALGEYLQSRGFDVRTTAEGTRGLAMLEEQTIPLAVIDFNMPGMNGLELLRQIRHRRRNVTVFVLTSEDDPTLERRMLAEGAWAFLPKTTAPQRIVEALRSALPEYDLHASEAVLHALNRLLPVPIRAQRTLPVPLWLFQPKRN